MLDAILKEIQITPFHTGTEELPVNTIYFGGGTPSLLETSSLKAILEAIKKRFVVSKDPEITLEANPDDISATKLSEWRALGINRFSVGIQSFQDAELSWMNRAHTAVDSLQCIDMIRAAGFDNFSADLIYGSPLLSDEDWKKNVATLIDKQVPHISCYALTVEPKTALHQMIRLQKKLPVDTDKQARQFEELMDWMEQAGYEQYEISNFCKPGMRSKHNSSYWLQLGEGTAAGYYGFGPSAHSFDGQSRSWNIANNALYIRSLQLGDLPRETEQLSASQKLNEYIMTALRTHEGINLKLIEEYSGIILRNQVEDAGKKWQQNECMLIRNEQMSLTKKGKLFADGIASDLFVA